MQVKIANSGTDFVCLKERLSTLQARHDAQTYPATLSYKTAIEKGKHMLMSATKLKSSDERHKYTIEIKDENSDLEVTIEGSDHLYGSRLTITPHTADFDSKYDENGRSMGKLLNHIFGAKNSLKATHIASPKHMTKYSFRNVPVGTYTVHLQQPEKPKDCENIVDVLFQIS